MRFAFRHCPLGALVVFSLLVLAVSPLLAQDITKVAPTGIKVVFENDQVRILDVVTQPGSSMAVHSHPAMMVVTLSPGTTRFTGSTGQVDTVGADAKRGTGTYRPAESHSSQNVGKTNSHSILIEFKQPAPSPATARRPSMPAPYKWVSENAHAVQFEVVIPPGGSVPTHAHGNHVVVVLEGGTAELTDQGGIKSTVNFVKDSAQFDGPVTHSGVNTGKTPMQLVVVELK